MKQFFLALLLIVVPVSAFIADLIYFESAGVPAASSAPAALGDLSSFEVTVADAQSITTKGDMAAAETRMTDFESAWDVAQPRLRALDSAA